MKRLVYILILILTPKIQAQAPVVHDPTNAGHLLTIGNVLNKIQEVENEIQKRLESIESIKKINDVVKLAKVMEQSYCVIKDYDMHLSLEKDRQSSCFYDFNMSLNMNIIKNSLSQITSAITADLMTVNERNTMINDAVNNIKSSTEKINKEKEALQKSQELNRNKEILANMYN